MSVQLVSSNHINTIMQFAEAVRASYVYNSNFVEISHINAKKLAQSLFDANVKAYNEEYNDDSFAIYQYGEAELHQHGLKIVKLCHSLNYQCCGLKGWQTSPEKALLDGIIYSAITRHDEYEKAQWTI